MKPGRVLITGAGGFVGQALVRGFADLGWYVIGLDRCFDDAADHEGDRRVISDLAQGVPSDVPAVDLVVHAAWVTSGPATPGLTTAQYTTLNLRPLRAVMEYATRTRPGAFVFISSSGVFAPEDATEGLTDGDTPSGASPYAVAKREAELLVSTALESTTVGHVVRLGYLFGPGEAARPSRPGVSLVAGWLAAARDGQPLEVRSDDPLRDWTFTPDLAAALERVVDGPPAGHPVHLGSSHVVSDGAFAALISAQLPGTQVVRVQAECVVKPPMVPSEIRTLLDFGWTDPAAGLRALLNGDGAS